MGEQPSRTLLWSSRIVPIEIRGLLRGIVALFGITAIAMLAVSGPTLQTVLAATGTSALNIVITLWLTWSWDRTLTTNMVVAALLVAAAALTTSVAGTPATPAVLATGLPFAFAIAWLPAWWLPLTLALASIWGGGVLQQTIWNDAYPVQEALIMTVLLGAPTFAFTAANIGWQLQLRLDQHHADQNELTLTRERLRFATDLHDIQGHTLLTIQRKAELARRTIDHDPYLAHGELSSIEVLAAKADRQTHDLAHGYRTLNLTAELGNAEQLLTAAGITVDVRRAGTPPKHHNELFAALVREATSNILRHSRATNVRVYINANTLIIDNDGASTYAARPYAGQGSGLMSLQRRFTDHGGTFTWQPNGDLFTVAGEVGAQP